MYNPLLGWFAVVLMAVGAYVLAVSSSEPPWLPIWWLGMGALTCAMYGFDKQQARADRGRVRERTLLVLNLIGGWLGGWIGMFTFRHKTQHGSFVLVQALSTLLHLGAYLWWVMR